MSGAAYPMIGDGFSIYENTELGRSQSSWAPRPYSSWTLLNSLNHLPRVKDLFDVKQGVITGCNDAFIVRKSQLLDLPRGERRFFRPAVVNDSIRQGCLVDSAHVFYPYGTLRIETESELKKSVESYYQEILVPCKERLMSRPKIDQGRWWELTWPRDWQTGRVSRLMSTYFGDSGSFALDESGDYVICQGYAWLPRGRAVLSVRASLAYLAILNSRLFSELLSATSNNVGGGQWNLSKRFVNMIAIPDLLSRDMGSRIVRTLAEIGEEMKSGGMDRVDKAVLEETVRMLYGVESD